MNDVKVSTPSNTQQHKTQDQLSILYIAEFLYKIYCLPDKIKILITLINIPYTGRDIQILERDVKEVLSEEIINYLFYICNNLDKPKILDNKKLLLKSGTRYGYQGRGIERERLLKDMKFKKSYQGCIC